MASSEADRAHLSGLTLLYVEDEPSIRSSTAEFLRRRVKRLCLAEDGLDGLGAFRQEHPDLVVTDIMMPRLDGLALAEAIKAESPDTPIVVITAFEQNQFLLRAINTGVDRYVLKPVQPEQLNAALLHCAHQLRAEEELRQHLQLERELQLARHHESMSYLAKGMAHDYNNLLQAILSSVDAAAGHTTPGSPAHLILGMTQRFAATAQKLGQQLLALGQGEDQPDQEGSLTTLLETVLHEALDGSDIAVARRFAPDAPSVHFNRERLQQALTSLLINAREAMPEGGAMEVHLAACEVGPDQTGLQLAPGTYLRLSLQDTGRGIPADQLPRIFDPYFSTKPMGSQKGQGLSLAVCRSILRAHGGQVTVESEVGRGTTFHLFFPAFQPSRA